VFGTCLFCHHPLDRNETFATFPVGRRVAYDPARGRLWVICRACARWNLSPLEERWEAIEEAERRFGETRLRAGSGEIALARLAEGTELVRIGRPERLELAAWRYGDQFRRRRTRALAMAGGVLAGGGLALVGAVSAGLGVMAAWQAANLLHTASLQGAPWRPIARLRTPAGTVMRVLPSDLRLSTMESTTAGVLRLRIVTTRRRPFSQRTEPTTFTGSEALGALRQLLPGVNRLGGTADEVRRALARLDHAGTPERLFADVARNARTLTPVDASSSIRELLWGTYRPEMRSGLYAIPAGVSLAMEIALHDEQERQALEGDLRALEAAWREAEEIAAIADDLLLPASVLGRLRRLKGS